MRNRRGAIAALLASALFAVGGGLFPADGAEPDADPSRPSGHRVRYVALGDSAAAGPVILPQQRGPATCLRSERNFPTYTAAAVRAWSFADATCSGAEVDDLWHPQADGVPRQLAALDEDTTLVTLGPIGANDVDLVTTVLTCLLPGCSSRDGRTVHRAIQRIRPEIRAALRAVERHAPRADIVVVGYGRYFPSGGCPFFQPFTAADADYIQGLVNHVDDVLRTAARRAGATFADLRRTPGASDHTLCAPPGQRWLEGLIPLSADGAAPFHPTALGMKAFSGQVATAVRTARRHQR